MPVISVDQMLPMKIGVKRDVDSFEDRNESNKTSIISAAVGGSAVVLAIAILIFCIKYQKRRKARRKLIKIEQKARELLKREISFDHTYQELIEDNFTGFMDAYVKLSGDDKTMTTGAKQALVLDLAKKDKLRDQTFKAVTCLTIVTF